MADGFLVRIEGIDQLQRKLDQLGKQAPRAVAGALSDTAVHVRKLAVQDITSIWNIKAKDVRPVITVRKASPANLSASVTASSRPIGVIKFGARELKRGGVSYALQRGRRQVMRDAFITTMDTGHTGVFRRRGAPRKMTKGKYAGKVYKRGERKGQAVLRQPILEKRAITVTSQWRQRIEFHLKQAQPFLRRRLIGQVERLLNAQQGGK